MSVEPGLRSAAPKVGRVQAVLVPLVFTLSPVVGMVMLSAQVIPAPLASVARIICFAALLALVVYTVARRRLDPVTASNVAALPIFLVGMYPAAYSLVQRVVPVPEPLVSLPYLSICLLSALGVARTTPQFARTLHDLLSIVAAILLTVSVLTFGRVYFWPAAYPAPVAAAISQLSASLALHPTTGWTPDVYHLVLDGMGRPDILAERYDLDTDGSIDALKQLGFEVGRSRGHANYVQTHLSLSSMLNLVYLDELLDAQRGSHNRSPLWDLIARARVPAAFKRLGYEVEFIGSGYASDGTFLVADSCDCSQLWFTEGSEVLALSMTPFEGLLRMGFGHRAHYDRSLRVFDRFERARTGSRPRFVFAHTMLPHPPFVADERGNFTGPRKQLSGADASFFPGTAEEYRTGYRAQASYAFRRAVQASRHVLEASRRDRRDAIVIITGDHGPRLGFDARNPTAESGLATLPVLLAIHWPSRAQPGLSPGSLVNVYRAVFSKAFGMKLPMLADKGYVSSFSTPYQVIAVKGLEGDQSSSPD